VSSEFLFLVVVFFFFFNFVITKAFSVMFEHGKDWSQILCKGRRRGQNVFVVESGCIHFAFADRSLLQCLLSVGINHCAFPLSRKGQSHTD